MAVALTATSTATLCLQLPSKRDSNNHMETIHAECRLSWADDRRVKDGASMKCFHDTIVRLFDSNLT